MSQWTVRRAQSGDAPGLTACMHAAYIKHAALGDLPPLPTDYAEEINTCQVWVATSAGRVIGGLVLVPADGFMQLANVAVHPDHAGIGIGKALITLAEEQASQQGYPEIHLNTHAGMTDNVSLYQHLGWQTTGTKGATVSMKKGL